MNDDRIDWHRLDRFVRGEGTAEERAALARWVHADERRRALTQAMRTIGSGDHAVPPPRDANAALRRVTRQAAFESDARVGRRRFAFQPASSRGLQRLLLACGLASIAVATGIVFSSRRAPSPGPAGPPRDVVTQPGERAHVNLGDGTRVVLSADSHLRIPGDFADASKPTREVSLEGEAMFAVQHDSIRPFVVRTPFGFAEDLGTEFVINTYPEVRGMRLAVREGRVAVHARRNAIAQSPRSVPEQLPDTVAILTRGDVLVSDTSGRVVISHGQSMEPLFASAEGTLELKAISLTDAIPRLERWYGIRVRVSDRALLSRRVSGSFRYESPTAALGVIALALESKATWRESEVTLAPDPQRGEHK